MGLKVCKKGKNAFVKMSWQYIYNSSIIYYSAKLDN